MPLLFLGQFRRLGRKTLEFLVTQGTSLFRYHTMCRLIPYPYHIPLAIHLMRP
jgi:hypothetical protein